MNEIFKIFAYIFLIISSTCAVDKKGKITKKEASDAPSSPSISGEDISHEPSTSRSVIPSEVSRSAVSGTSKSVLPPTSERDPSRSSNNELLKPAASTQMTKKHKHVQKPLGKHEIFYEDLAPIIKDNELYGTFKPKDHRGYSKKFILVKNPPYVHLFGVPKDKLFIYGNEKAKDTLSIEPARRDVPNLTLYPTSKSVPSSPPRSARENVSQNQSLESLNKSQVNTKSIEASQMSTVSLPHISTQARDKPHASVKSGDKSHISTQSGDHAQSGDISRRSVHHVPSPSGDKSHISGHNRNKSGDQSRNISSQSGDHPHTSTKTVEKVHVSTRSVQHVSSTQSGDRSHVSGENHHTSTRSTRRNIPTASGDGSNISTQSGDRSLHQSTRSGVDSQVSIQSGDYTSEIQSGDKSQINDSQVTRSGDDQDKTDTESVDYRKKINRSVEKQKSASLRSKLHSKTTSHNQSSGTMTDPNAFATALNQQNLSNSSKDVDKKPTGYPQEHLPPKEKVSTRNREFVFNENKENQEPTNSKKNQNSSKHSSEKTKTEKSKRVGSQIIPRPTPELSTFSDANTSLTRNPRILPRRDNFLVVPCATTEGTFTSHYTTSNYPAESGVMQPEHSQNMEKRVPIPKPAHSFSQTSKLIARNDKKSKLSSKFPKPPRSGTRSPLGDASRSALASGSSELSGVREPVVESRNSGSKRISSKNRDFKGFETKGSRDSPSDKSPKRHPISPEITRQRFTRPAYSEASNSYRGSESVNGPALKGSGQTSNESGKEKSMKKRKLAASVSGSNSALAAENSAQSVGKPSHKNSASGRSKASEEGKRSSPSKVQSGRKSNKRNDPASESFMSHFAGEPSQTVSSPITKSEVVYEGSADIGSQKIGSSENVGSAGASQSVSRSSLKHKSRGSLSVAPSMKSTSSQKKREGSQSGVSHPPQSVSQNVEGEVSHQPESAGASQSLASEATQNAKTRSGSALNASQKSSSQVSKAKKMEKEKADSRAGSKAGSRAGSRAGSKASSVKDLPLEGSESINNYSRYDPKQFKRLFHGEKGGSTAASGGQSSGVGEPSGSYKSQSKVHKNYNSLGSEESIPPSEIAVGEGTQESSGAQVGGSYVSNEPEGSVVDEEYSGDGIVSGEDDEEGELEGSEDGELTDVGTDYQDIGDDESVEGEEDSEDDDDSSAFDSEMEKTSSKDSRSHTASTVAPANVKNTKKK